MSQYTLSQIFAVFAYFVIGLSYYAKNKEKILLLTLTSTALFLIEYTFLHGTGAMIVNTIGIFRCIVFYIDDKKGRVKNYISLLLFVVISIIASAIFLKSYIELMAMGASIIFIYSLWQRNILVYRCLGALNSTIWLVYNSIYRSVVGIIGESSLLIATIISIIIYLVTNKKDSINKDSRPLY